MTVSTTWRPTRLRFEVNLNPPAKRARLLPPTTEVTFMAMESLHENGSVDLDVTRPISEVAASYSSFETGDVVVAKVTPCFENGKAALAPEMNHGVAFGTTEITVLRTLEGMDPRFLYYVVSEDRFRQMGVASMTGAGGLRRVPDRFVRDFTLKLPPLDEQHQIAEYLDRETGKIDELIAKQELLVEVLTERRDATILKGVTRGLHPAVVMKESPAAWTPEIPAHWSGGNIRRFALMKTGHTPSRTRPEYWEDCNTPWFTLADVWQLRKGQRFMGDTAEKVSEVGLANSAAELLPKGTVVLSRTASVGFIGIMPRPMATSQDYWNWVPGPKLKSEYLYLQLLAMRPHLMSLMRGSTHKTIYQSTAASLSLVVPPLEEQRAIVEAVDQEMAKGAALIETASRAMALLRERRSALISAAVTGEIDVSSSSTQGDVT